MARRKRMEHHRQALHNQRLRVHEILCEECGSVYDERTGEGLCGYCVGDRAPEDGGGGVPSSTP